MYMFTESLFQIAFYAIWNREIAIWINSIIVSSCAWLCEKSFTFLCNMHFLDIRGCEIKGKKTELVYWTEHLFKFNYFLVNMKWIKTYFLKVVTVFIDIYIYRFCIQLIFLML